MLGTPPPHPTSQPRHLQGEEEEKSPRQGLFLMVLLLSPKSYQRPRDNLAYLVNTVDGAKVIPSLGNVLQLRAAAFPVTPGCTAWVTPRDPTETDSNVGSMLCVQAPTALAAFRGKRGWVGKNIPAGLNAP